jgi:hypothetical protein
MNPVESGRFRVGPFSNCSHLLRTHLHLERELPAPWIESRSVRLYGPVLLGMGILLIGCGGSSGGGGGDKSSAAAANNAAIQSSAQQGISERQVTAELKRTLDAKPDSYGIGLHYSAPGAVDHCSIVVILTNPREINLYRGNDPAQPVVTDPSGSVGVKVSSTTQDKAACLRAAEVALAKAFPPGD